MRIDGYTKDTALAEAHPKLADGFTGITIEGKVYTDKDEAGMAILDVCAKMTGADAVHLGEYRGFSATVSYQAIASEYRMSLKGALSHSAVLGTDIYGNFTRMDNVLEALPKRLEQEQASLAELTHQLENAKAELETPFSRDAELAEKEARLKELNILLNMDEKDDALIDDAPDVDAADRPAMRDRER